MAELLPCPLCGHLNIKPTHHSHFKCAAPKCRHWLELRKGNTQLSDYTARKAADKARVETFWHQKALIEQQKLGVDYDLAMQLARASHDRNNKKMREEAEFAKLFPQEKTTPAPKSQTYTNKTKPIVAMSTTSEDDTDAPF